MSNDEESWLPNLVGGVSIWKLAPDLNESQFFDGRLLVPETEGSDALPARVDWDLTGLISLNEARTSHPEAVEQAIAAFFECLERTAAVFKKGGSGYDRYKEAFTVPALSADGGAHYFFDPGDDTLKVINWGASPRKIKHESSYVFGYAEFRDLIRSEQGRAEQARLDGSSAPHAATSSPESGEAGADLVADASVANDATDGDAAREESDAGQDNGEDNEEEADDGSRPWWHWLLVVAGLLFLLALVFALLRDCQDLPLAPTTDDAGVAADAVGDAGLAEEPIYGNATDDAGPPPTELQHDAGAADGGLADGAADATDAGSNPEDAEPDGGSEGSGGEGAGEGSGGEGAGGEGSGGEGSQPPTNSEGEPIYGESRDPRTGPVYWLPGAGGRAVTLPGRSYHHPEAVQWRIVGGTRAVYDHAGSGQNFRVYLHPGQNFDGVQVQWRDASGSWHDH